jgi:lysozyme
MAINNLTYSNNGLSLTEQFEGCKLTAYQDQVGVWTIGYGHTGHDVAAGLTITQDQAQNLLAQDVTSAAACVNKSVTVALNQNQFDALVDFVFNLGAGAFLSSSLLRDLNAGNFTAAAAQFNAWDHAGGVVVPGLLRRRQAETALFTTPMPAADPTTDSSPDS